MNVDNGGGRVMRVAITGATGFLGRYLVHHLTGTGHQLRCWYRTGSDRSGFDRKAGAVDWQVGELGDASASRNLVRGVDAVVHAAVQWEGPRNRGRGSHGAAKTAARNGSPVPTTTSQATLRRSSRPNKCRVSMPEMNISSNRPS